MARYRVVELSYVNERIVEPGEEVEFVGIPAGNLELIGDKEQARAETLAALQAEAQALGIDIDKGYGAPRLQSMISEIKNRQNG